MTVSKAPVAILGMTPLSKTGARAKLIPETRPVTATLECPAILDITFLKKLDMTSFTKKGLMAISKICGISLVKRSDDKKLRKRLKRHAVERVKKEARQTAVGKESNEEHNPQPKVTSMPKIRVSDIGCNRNDLMKDASSVKTISPRLKVKDTKPSIQDILYGHVEIVVAEPCKACGRSEQPERFHSHPKNVSGRKHQKKVVQSPNDSGRSRVHSLEMKSIPSRLTVTTKTTVRRHSTGHLQSDEIPKLAVADLEPSFHSDHEIEVIKMSMPVMGNRSGSSSPGKKKLKPKLKPRGKIQEGITPIKGSPTPSHCNQPTESSAGVKPTPSEELKFVTGCYVCGEQTSPELRFAHEEKCISEWRKQNSHLPPDKRKAEPLRPDFRFTVTGAVDFEGTFNSIWANHVDSLVPCVKCNRTFFPERIEKHEACCTVQSKKHKTPKSRNK